MEVGISSGVVAVAVAVAVMCCCGFGGGGTPICPHSSSMGPAPLQQLHDPFRQVCKPAPASALASKKGSQTGTLVVADVRAPAKSLGHMGRVLRGSKDPHKPRY